MAFNPVKYENGFIKECQANGIREESALLIIKMAAEEEPNRLAPALVGAGLGGLLGYVVDPNSIVGTLAGAGVGGLGGYYSDEIMKQLGADNSDEEKMIESAREEEREKGQKPYEGKDLKKKEDVFKEEAAKPTFKLFGKYSPEISQAALDAGLGKDIQSYDDVSKGIIHKVFNEAERLYVSEGLDANAALKEAITKEMANFVENKGDSFSSMWQWLTSASPTAALGLSVEDELAMNNMINYFNLDREAYKRWADVTYNEHERKRRRSNE